MLIFYYRFVRAFIPVQRAMGHGTVVITTVSVRSNENLHFHGTSNTSKKLYHLQISEIFTSSKNDNFENLNVKGEKMKLDVTKIRTS